MSECEGEERRSRQWGGGESNVRKEGRKVKNGRKRQEELKKG